MAFALSIIRADAMNWWWYRQLRGRGEVKEALKLERASIRRTTEDLRSTLKNGGWLLIRPNGDWTLHPQDGTTISGSQHHVAIPDVAPQLGITTVDFRRCDENIMFSVWMWEPNPWRPETPPLPNIWSRHQRVPLWYYTDRCIEAGATIHNYPNPKR